MAMHGVLFLDELPEFDRRVLAQAEAAANGVRRARPGLRIGYLGDAIPERLPAALRRTAHEFPQTRIVLDTAEPQKLLADLRDDLLDVAVVSLPAPVAGLRVTPLGSFGSGIPPAGRNTYWKYGCSSQPGFMCAS